MRFEKPSEIQASTLPLILDHKSVIAQAQSGAGKTIAFAIGMLAKVDVNFRGLQALCLAPTRELVNQIVDNAIKPLSSRIPGITYEKALPGIVRTCYHTVPEIYILVSNIGIDIYPGTVCTTHIVVGTTGA
jgi:superfamily II DNA/RNA helicase